MLAPDARRPTPRPHPRLGIDPAALLAEASDGRTGARALRLARHAFGEPFTSLPAAISALGASTLRDLDLLARALDRALPIPGLGLTHEALERHALLVGRLAPRITAGDAATARTAGFLQGIGVALLSATAPRYPDVVRAALADGVPLERAERDRLGTDHLAVAAWTAEVCGLEDAAEALAELGGTAGRAVAAARAVAATVLAGSVPELLAGVAPVPAAARREALRIDHELTLRA